MRNEISSDNEIKPNGLCNLLISCCLDRCSPLKIHFILSFSNKDPTRRGWGVVKYSFVWDRQTFRVEENFYFSCCIWFELQARLQYEKLHLPLPILSFLIKHFWPCQEATVNLYPKRKCFQSHNFFWLNICLLRWDSLFDIRLIQIHENRPIFGSSPQF